MTWTPRTLVWPVYSFPGNVDADSLFVIARNLIEAATGGHWILLVPDGWKGLRTTFTVNPGVTYEVQPIPMSWYFKRQEAEPAMHAIERLSPLTGRAPVDLALSFSPALTRQLAHAWTFRLESLGWPVMATWDLLARTDKHLEIKTGHVELLTHAVGMAASDLVLHESPIARRVTMDACRRFLAPSEVRQIRDRSREVWQGVPTTTIRAIARDTPRRERFTVYYGGRFSTSKRVREIAETIDAFYRFGREVDFVITTGAISGGVRREFERKFPQIEWHVGLSQRDAWQVMASCHASLCFSQHELFGMAFWEQMAAGLQVVMHARDWNRDILSRGYPLLAGSHEIAGVHLRALYDLWKRDPAAFPRLDGEWARWADYRMSMRTTMLSLEDATDTLIRARQNEAERHLGNGRTHRIVDLVDQLADDGMPFDALIDAINKEATSARAVGFRDVWAKSAPTMDVLRILRYRGWDTHGAGMQLIRRNDG